jgi:hypothetical protein
MLNTRIENIQDQLKDLGQSISLHPRYISLVTPVTLQQDISSSSALPITENITEDNIEEDEGFDMKSDVSEDEDELADMNAKIVSSVIWWLNQHKECIAPETYKSIHTLFKSLEDDGAYFDDFEPDLLD